MKQYIFVGERRSPTAIKNGWSWTSGRLAAKQLFDALKAIGIDPNDHLFTNLWADDGTPIPIPKVAGTVVGMGKVVQDELDNRGIKHLKLIHPAARGAIRRKKNYARHVKSTLVKT